MYFLSVFILFCIRIIELLTFVIPPSNVIFWVFFFTKMWVERPNVMMVQNIFGKKTSDNMQKVFLKTLNVDSVIQPNRCELNVARYCWLKLHFSCYTVTWLTYNRCFRLKIFRAVLCLKRVAISLHWISYGSYGRIILVVFSNVSQLCKSFIIRFMVVLLIFCVFVLSNQMRTKQKKLEVCTFATAKQHTSIFFLNFWFSFGSRKKKTQKINKTTLNVIINDLQSCDTVEKTTKWMILP